jgi:hypothetical protein
MEMIRRRGRGSIGGRMGPFIRAALKMIIGMAMGRCFGPMGGSIKGSGPTE